MGLFNSFDIFKTIGDMIGLVVGASILDALFQSIEHGNESYVMHYRILYPKWLSFKQFKQYRSKVVKRRFRHIQQENKRLIVGVTIMN